LSKIRSYWDIQREIIGCFNFDKYDIDEDDRFAICETIAYAIKISHNLGYDRGYQSIRRQLIEGAFQDDDNKWIKANPNLLMPDEWIEIKANPNPMMPEELLKEILKLPLPIEDLVPPNAIREHLDKKPINKNVKCCCYGCGYDISTLGKIDTCPYCGAKIV
jgi:hypothetical protein